MAGESFREVREKTGLVARGIVEKFSTTEYDGKKYHKIELYVKGLGIIKVSIPDDFDKSKFPDGELVTMPLDVAMKDGKYTFKAQVA